MVKDWLLFLSDTAGACSSPVSEKDSVPVLNAVPVMGNSSPNSVASTK